ncbi:restriction endonuclease subunit S [Dokdonella immobilis]|uniref:Restriction endonuclease S subunit n=1 Tax=Dokdonella immobilis TaxID=578942 RepID=A0A1I4ZSL0_9GAMM|nr:restriction endonuclease subunit S [Dokdonella immobilis]SFN53222.1 Restriction endonuclease S subunit [Dokdonella immobilis]
MLPEGWVRKPLSACAKFVSGGTPSKGNDAYWGGEFPWITAKDMKTLWLKKAGLGLTDQGRSAATIVPSGSILTLTRGMTLLKDFPVCLAGRELAFNQDIKALLPHGDVDSTFLAYQLIANKQNVLNLVDTAGHGTGRLDTELLKGLLIDLPPLPEQRQIAAGLATWDKAIAIAERLLVNSRQQKLSLLSKTLCIPAAVSEVSDRDRSGSLPPSVRAGIPKLPRTPAGWERVHLGKYLREVNRPVMLEPEREYTLVTVKRSRGGVHRREVLHGGEVKTRTQFIVKTGDFLISKRQIVHGACGIVPSELDGAVVSNEYAVMNADDGIDLDFLRHLSESIYFQQTCFHSSIGVHVEKMIFKTERWLAWPFNIPPLHEQRRIVEVLDAATAEVTAIERQLGALKLEKHALMQQLLTGKRRVHLLEPAEAAGP